MMIYSISTPRSNKGLCTAFRGAGSNDRSLTRLVILDANRLSNLNLQKTNDISHPSVKSNTFRLRMIPQTGPTRPLPGGMLSPTTKWCQAQVGRFDFWLHASLVCALGDSDIRGSGKQYRLGHADNRPKAGLTRASSLANTTRRTRGRLSNPEGRGARQPKAVPKLGFTFPACRLLFFFFS
jgi:hypothetical protein